MTYSSKQFSNQAEIPNYYHLAQLCKMGAKVDHLDVRSKLLRGKDWSPRRNPDRARAQNQNRLWVIRQTGVKRDIQLLLKKSFLGQNQPEILIPK